MFFCAVVLTHCTKCSVVTLCISVYSMQNNISYLHVFDMLVFLNTHSCLATAQKAFWRIITYCHFLFDLLWGSPLVTLSQCGRNENLNNLREGVELMGADGCCASAILDRILKKKLKIFENYKTGWLVSIPEPFVDKKCLVLQICVGIYGHFRQYYFFKEFQGFSPNILS